MSPLTADPHGQVMFTLIITHLIIFKKNNEEIFPINVY